VRNSGIINMVYNTGFRLSVPVSISYWWNIRSMLILIWTIQVVSGLILSSYYIARMRSAFDSVDFIIREVKCRWTYRYVHVVGSQLFIGCLLVHVLRGLFYGGYARTSVWSSGICLMLLFILVCFLGYVLPMRQMSIWRATVITNLITVLPYREGIVRYVWRRFSIGSSIVRRCFILHYLLPFIGWVLVLVHLVQLHVSGSGSSVGRWNCQFLSFFPYYVVKDLRTVVLLMLILVLGICKPLMFVDADNWIPADPIVTPPHIKPEWYFLVSYAVLRSFDSKTARVMRLLGSILIFWMPSLKVYCMIVKKRVPALSIKGTLVFCCFLWIYGLLLYVGRIPCTDRFLATRKTSTLAFFSFRLLLG